MKKKRTKREQRLQAARPWLAKYEGKHIVKGYRKHFGVDIICAITELQMLVRTHFIIGYGEGQSPLGTG